MEFKATLKSYVVPADSNVKELRDSSHGQSQNGSPVGSPKHTDAVQRFSILSKHQLHGAASTSGNGTAPGDGGADPAVAGFMVRQVRYGFTRMCSRCFFAIIIVFCSMVCGVRVVEQLVFSG